MNTLAPKTNIIKDAGVTTLFQLNSRHSIYVPKVISWDEVKLPESWIIHTENREENL